MEAKSHWEAIYAARRPDEVSWFQSFPALSLELIHASKVGKSEAMIDVGGGASRLVDTLLEDGYQDLSVLDISAGALAHSKDRLGKRAADVTWIESDITRFTPARSYAIWHDRAVFHFLREFEDRRSYLMALEKGLRPGGTLILAAFAPDGPEKCSNLPVCRYDATGIQAELGRGFVLQGTQDEVHPTPRGTTQHFNYFIFKKAGAPA
jgi:trans-aconitate methyltransferase